jgi:hypothetical protein
MLILPSLTLVLLSYLQAQNYSDQDHLLLVNYDSTMTLMSLKVMTVLSGVLLVVAVLLKLVVLSMSTAQLQLSHTPLLLAPMDSLSAPSRWIRV